MLHKVPFGKRCSPFAVVCCHHLSLSAIIFVRYIRYNTKIQSLQSDWCFVHLANPLSTNVKHDYSTHYEHRITTTQTYHSPTPQNTTLSYNPHRHCPLTGQSIHPDHYNTVLMILATFLFINCLAGIQLATNAHATLPINTNTTSVQGNGTLTGS